jgi:hypothetical protein
MSDSTQRLIREMTTDLAPVSLVPRLRVSLASLLHCPNMEVAHQILGHALAPLFGSLLLLTPALLLLRKLSPGFVAPR